MQDPYFKRAAVLVCEHHKKGSLGFILNKKLDMQLNELMGSFPPFEADVFYGGPVQTDTLHYLHNMGDLLEDSIFVAPGVWWGGNFDKLKFLVSADLVQAHNIRFFIGYSGWGEQQLNEEIEIGSWLSSEMDANYLFGIRPDRLWKQAMEHKGSAFSVLAQIPADGMMLN